jgi:tRNA A-37 threonylcarbamoyl transferase component Bud32
MDWLRAQGLPVPRVDDPSDTGTMVMEYIPGPTMFEQVSSAPQGFVRHAKTLAQLQRQINAVTAPAWFPERSAGGVVVHMDLHPMNVIYGPKGPVVIDWTNFAQGSPALDAGMTAVLIGAFEAQHVHERIGRRLFSSTFSMFRGHSIVRAGILEAAELRVKDPNVTDQEQRAIAEIIRTHRRRSPKT